MRIDTRFLHNFKVLTLCPGKWAINIYIISRLLYLIKLYPLAVIVYRLGQYITGTDISFKAEIGYNLYIPHPFGIVVGPTAKIGNNVSIMQGVTIGSSYLFLEGKRHPTVGDNVIIGANAVLLGPIIIGKNVVIGANSTILHDLDNDCTYVGNPARKIKNNNC